MVGPIREHWQIEFPGKDPAEHFRFYFRQHWIRLAPRCIKVLLWTLVLFAIGVLLFSAEGVPGPTRHILLVLLTFLILFFQFELLWAFYQHFLYVVIVSDRKIHRIKRTLLAVDDHQSINLRMLQDVSKSQHGIIQNLLGFGSLTFEAQETVLKIHFIPRIRTLYQRMAELKEEGRPGGYA